MSAHLLESLNPEQRAAVTLPHESALILAGAGSGKTRVLTTRMVWLIQNSQVSPLGMLAVTFTNKAAKEMLTRISAMLPINTRGMWVGTFHGLANRLLRTHYREAGLPQSFQILDSSDQLSAIKRLMKSMNVDTEKFEPKKVQWFINGHKEAGRRARDAEAFDEYSMRMAELYEAYDAQCQREGVADFPELLLRSYELLVRNEPLREHYRDRFKHILVDEFQDTNTLQYRWLKQFAGPHTALFAVGDDDQSIYAFRGANTANMAEFEREFAHGNVIKLEQNYRSHGHILTAANTLISQNAHRLGKNLWTAEGEGEPIRVFDAYSDQEEARFVVEEVRALNREGTNLSDMALLYRSNAQSRVLEHALFSANVPYRVYGGLRFFERQEIKHALAYLRLLTNPEDDGAFLRVVNFPTRGIGARTLEQLADNAARSGASLWQAACTGGGKVAGFAKLVEDIKQATRDLPLPEVIDHVIEASGLADYYRADKDGADRLENLNELINAATLFADETEAGVHDPIEGEVPADESAVFPRTQCLSRPRRAGSGRAPGHRRSGCAATDDRARRQGTGVSRRVHHRTGRRPVSARAKRERGKRPGRRTAADVRGDHPRTPTPVSVAHAIAHAARPDPLQHAVALSGRVARTGFTEPQPPQRTQLRIQRAPDAGLLQCPSQPLAAGQRYRLQGRAERRPCQVWHRHHHRF